MMRSSRPTLLLRFLVVLLILASQVWLVAAASPPTPVATAHAAFLSHWNATDVVIGQRQEVDAKGTKPGASPSGGKVTTTATGLLGDPLPAGGRRFAIILGINDYPGASSDLNYCVADAKSVWSVLLTDYGFSNANITFLQDGEVTRTAIFDAVTNLGLTANDELVFFYSGHGSKGKVLDGGRIQTEQAIVVCNSDYSGFDFIWTGQLKALFDTLPACRILFAFDSCYAGGMTVLGKANREVVAACGINALSTESSAYGGGHGQFTWYFFCQGMDAGYADLKGTPGVVTAEEAFDYTKALSRSQTPVLSDGYANDLVP